VDEWWMMSGPCALRSLPVRPAQLGHRSLLGHCLLVAVAGVGPEAGAVLAAHQRAALGLKITPHENGANRGGQNETYFYPRLGNHL